MISDPLAILAVLLGVICLALHLVERYQWARRVSAIMLIIFLSALCSNLGLIPTDAPLYNSIMDFAVPFAVCVILFTVSLSDVLSAGRPMLGAFVLASVATVVGVLVASLALQGPLAETLGDESWKISGPYTGTYIGGSLNFVSLWDGLEIEDPDLFAAANAVDNLTLFPLFALWMLVPVWLAGKWIPAEVWTVNKEVPDDQLPKQEKPPFDPVQIATLAFLAVAVMALSNWLKTTLIDPVMPELPGILIVTTLALIVAQFGPVRRLQGAWQIGDMAFYVFFAAVGALINFYQAVVLSPILFVYVAIIMLVHFAVLYGVGWLLRMEVSVLTLASVATKGGPAFVPPVAEAKQWRHLVLSGIIIAMLGYAVGNYIGYGVAQLVRLVT
ncbi:MAG: DUF819 domain-containing protein [Pirellulaceae bacterium]